MKHTHRFTKGRGPKSCVCGVNTDQECQHGHPRTDAYRDGRNVWVCRTCQRARVTSYRKAQEEENPERIERYKARNRKSQAELLVVRRAQCLEGYGGACACCGEAIARFLTLDHVNNDGAKHRQELSIDGGKSPGSLRIYAWAVKNNFPPSLQLLCYNCNFGRARNNNVCPHKEVMPNDSPTV